MAPVLMWYVVGMYWVPDSGPIPGEESPWTRGSLEGAKDHLMVPILTSLLRTHVVRVNNL